ncbi:MAG: hypothetical protein ACRDCD_00250 [Mycoplasmoidaceae bacterium]
MKVKNKTKNNFNGSSWIKTKHYLFIFLKFFLVIGVLIGSALSIIFSSFYISKSENSTGEFGNTYNIKFEVDLAIEEGNQNLSGNQSNSIEASENRLKITAESFEQWLFSKEIYNDGVQYSIKRKDDGNYSGWIFTNLYNIDKVDFQFNKVNQDPMNVISKNVTNNFIEVIPYDKTRNPNQIPSNNTTLVNSIGMNATNPKKSSNPSEEAKENNSSLELPGVEFTFPSNVNIKRFMEFKSGTNSDVSRLPENYKWFVFNDLDSLVQRLNYVKSVCYWRQNKNASKYLELGQQGLFPLTLYDPNINESEEGIPNGVENLNHIEFLYTSLTDEEKTWGDIASGDNADDTVAVNKSNILDFYNQFDSRAPSGATDKTTGNFDASIQPLVKKHIVAEIDYLNYHKWFPQAHELSPVVEEESINNSTRLPSAGQISGPEEVNTIKIPVEKESTLPDFLFNESSNKNVDELIKFFNEYGSLSPITSFVNSSIIPDETQKIQFYGSGSVTVPLISNSVTGMSAYNSIFLASGIIILTIAIIVSIIYRVPGLIASLAVIFTGVITFAFSNLLGLVFSFGSFLAIILGMLLTLCSSIVFLERVRKNMIDNKSIFDSNIISVNKSITTILDIHIISVIVGLATAMMGVLEMVDLGFELVLTSLVSLVSVFIIFIFTQMSFSKTKLFWKNSLYFYGINKKIKINSNLENNVIKKIEKPFKFSKQIFLSSSAIFLIVLLIVISLVFTIGVQNSLTFKTGTSIYIFQDANIENRVNVSQIIGLIGGNWNIKIDDNFILIQSSEIFSEADILSKISSLGLNSDSIYVARSSTNIINQVSSINTVALVVAAGFIAVYSTIRLGVFAVLPIFISTALVTLFSAAIQYILYIPIDNYFIYSMTFIFLLNNILSTIFISTTKSRFSNREIFDKDQIKLFLEKNILNLSHLWISLLLIVVLSISISMIFISTTLLWSFLSILIALVFSFPFTLLFTAYIYYVILLFRQKYIKNIVIDNITNTTYKFDSIDEELIIGINHRG